MNNFDPNKLPKASPRPTLTADTAVEYLEWIMRNLEHLSGGAAQMHMAAAELAIRTKANEAQAKATQHTLVEDGIIDPPPAAS